MKTLTSALICLLTLLLLPTVASAQAPAPKPNAKWTGSLSLGGGFFSGSVDKFNIQSEGKASNLGSLYEFSTFYKIVYGETNKKKDNEEYSAGLKYDWRPASRFTPFVATTAFRNIYRGIDLRFSGVAGAKYRILQDKDREVSVSAGLQADIQTFSASANAKPDRYVYRLSLRPKFRAALGVEHRFNATENCIGHPIDSGHECQPRVAEVKKG